MEYNVTISVKQNISDKEKSERIKQFQDAFVTAAVGYFSKSDNIPKKKNENTVA